MFVLAFGAVYIHCRCK